MVCSQHMGQCFRCVHISARMFSDNHGKWCGYLCHKRVRKLIMFGHAMAHGDVLLALDLWWRQSPEGIGKPHQVRHRNTHFAGIRVPFSDTPTIYWFWLVLTTSEVRAQHHAVLAQLLQVFGENGVGSLLWAHCGLVVDNHGTYPNKLEYRIQYYGCTLTIQ